MRYHNKEAPTMRLIRHLLGYDHTCSHAKGAHYCVMCGTCHCGQ